MGVLAIVMQLRSDTYLSLRGVPKWITTDFDGLRVGLLETIWLRSRGAPQSFKASTCALGGAESHLLIGFCATQMSRSRYSSTSNNSKIQHTILYLQWRTNCKSYMICRTAPFSMTLNNLEWFSNIFNDTYPVRQLSFLFRQDTSSAIRRNVRLSYLLVSFLSNIPRQRILKIPRLIWLTIPSVQKHACIIKKLF